MNCLASVLDCRFRGVFRSRRKPKYLLKSPKSFPLNRGPLSLLTDMGMPREAKVLSSLGITALALVEVTNSTTAHLDCFQTVTSRYSPAQIGPQKSIATSFHGSLGMGVMCSWATVTTWHVWQCWMCASTILYNPGNHPLARRYSLVLVMP